MPRTAHPRPSRPLAVGLALLALAVVLLAGTADAGNVASLHVKVAQNATLHKRILVTAKGHTLYSLSAEVHGKFICTDKACLALWKPLTLRRGQRAVGVRHLGSIKRPDGRRQVTYKGHPLYTFTQDKKKGQVGGEGFKDVGTWHAVVVKAKASATPAPSPTPTPTTPYSY